MRYLNEYGCVVKREGARHTIICNINNGVLETLPRHKEIDNVLIKKICRRLKIPVPF
ncbi:MAG TPA: addiction module toxin, HicA family [Candidatus Ratteibacteria bacterium]|nr:addiction module toxin, HicA family [Candidatus Ratteibacteria bacterium]